MIQCQSPLLLDYSARKLGPEATAEVDRHLAVCNACASFVAAQSALWTELDAWEPDDISAGFDGRLYAAIEKGGRRSWWAWNWRPTVRFAAAACATVVLALVLTRPSKHSVRTPPPPDIPRVEGIDAEQIDRTVEDLEMLREFVTPAPGQQTL
jgi:hypothetical protein